MDFYHCPLRDFSIFLNALCSRILRFHPQTKTKEQSHCLRKNGRGNRFKRKMHDFFGKSENRASKALFSDFPKNLCIFRNNFQFFAVLEKSENRGVRALFSDFPKKICICCARTLRNFGISGSHGVRNTLG